ncbi:MAG: endo-1,4-beta-xylanase [Candidatus Synoicihabitans palmerolidicus]|nr:endo-1,4-beta-xylanase [Candidatus Synoicihabitans palmerolidicus]
MERVGWRVGPVVYNQEQTVAALGWAQDNGLAMRGHVLVWPSVRNLPNWIAPLVESNDASVPQRVLTHIEDVITATAGKFVDWDVINEPYDNFDLMERYGYDLMAEWFKEARRLDAGVGLFINDYGLLTGGGLNTTKQDAYESTIKRILDDGGPLTGIAFQGHFSGSPTGDSESLGNLGTVFRRVSRYGYAYNRV